MSNKLSAVLVLCMSTVCLSGCDLLRATGPCFGVGCPGGTPGHSGQYKPGEAPKAQNASAPAPAATRTASVAAQANTVQSNAPNQTSSARAGSAPSANAATAAAQPTAVQEAGPEEKSSPLHSIGEFFARLIPHHNSGAKSGASD
jgi:type IV secretory pathway TrbL component